MDKVQADQDYFPLNEGASFSIRVSASTTISFTLRWEEGDWAAIVKHQITSDDPFVCRMHHTVDIAFDLIMDSTEFRTFDTRIKDFCNQYPDYFL